MLVGRTNRREFIAGLGSAAGLGPGAAAASKDSEDRHH